MHRTPNTNYGLRSRTSNAINYILFRLFQFQEGNALVTPAQSVYHLKYLSVVLLTAIQSIISLLKNV